MWSSNHKIEKINNYLKNSSRIVFILLLTLALFTIAILFNIAYSFVKDLDIIWSDFPDWQDDTIIFFILAVIIGPLFETWFNQYLPYYLLSKVKFLRERSYLILLISALFFGLNHFYSLFYIIYGILMGVVLMYGYMIKIKSDKKTFILIATCHGLLNLGVFILNVVWT